MLRKDAARMDLWELALRSFAKEPLGTGPATFEYTYRKDRTDAMVAHTNGGNVMQSHAHNGILESFATLGIMGALALAMLGKVVLERRKEEPVIFAALAAFAVPLMFNAASLEVYCVAAFLVGLLAKGEEDAPMTPAIGKVLTAFVLAVALPYTAAELSPRLQAHFPCEPEYLARMSETMAVEMVRRPALRGEIVSFAEDAARRGVRCRPNSAAMRQTAGVIYFYGASFGAPDRKHQSLVEMQAAKALDPHSEVVSFMLPLIDRLPGSR